MIEHLNSLSVPLVAAGWSHFLQVALFTALLALIDLTFGRRLGAHWRCALWLLVFVKLALPPNLALPTSPAYWWANDDAPSASTAMPNAAPMLEAAPDDTWAAAAMATAVDTTATASATTTVWPAWQAFVVSGWLTGVVTLAVATLAQRRRLGRLLRHSTPASSELQSACARACAQVALRAPVELRVNAAGISPMVVGLRRPTIHLPQSLVDRLAPDQLHAVLVHELYHVKRGDLWIATMQTVVRALFFYHPAVWWVNARLARLREEATDQAVLSHPEVDRRSYSLALVEAAAVFARAAPFPRFALGVIETKSQLQKRIAMNLYHPRSGRIHLGLPGLLSLSLVALVLVPMTPAEFASTASTTPARFKAIDAAGITRQIDTTIDRIFAAFNRRDRDAYIDAFTPDSVMLPPGSPMFTGSSGAGESYLRAPAGLSYETILWTDRQFHRIGRLVVETGLAGLQFRLDPNAPVMTDPRQVLTIWEERDDGTLRVKVLSWNPLPQSPDFRDRTETRAFVFATADAPFSASGDFSAVLRAEETFHGAFQQQRPTEGADYYAEDAVLFSPSAQPLRGHAAISRYLSSIPPDQLARTIERHIARVEGNENHVLVVNLFRWTFIPPRSDVPVAIAGKGIHLWERGEDGAWRILFDLPNASQPTGGS